MKKNVLALSITAAVVGFGFVGGAQAMTGALGGAGTGSDLELNGDGIGQMLLVPYYTAQNNNATLVNLVNTDTVNGKAVKVRFRASANSDDVFDFQVFLSPGDVYAFNISRNSAGLATLSTVDNSCTKPGKAVLTATPFVTTRLDPALDDGGKANGSREGYVEIFNMGDIPKPIAGAAAVGDLVGATDAGVAAAPATVNPLYTAIKHVGGVPPCSGAAWTKLDTTNLTWDAAANINNARSSGLLPPTTGLMANWIIIDTVNAAAWSRGAVAIQAVDGAGAATTGHVVYWPQTGTPVGTPAIDMYTADPLMRTADVSRWNATLSAYAGDATPAVAAAFFDLPDMSTPYTLAGGTPLLQAVTLTKAIAASSATNEFLTDPTILATTDWVFSQPTRRYSLSLDYAAIAAGDDGRRFTDLFGGGFITGYYLQQNTLVTARQICVKNIDVSVWDREEGNLAATTDVVVSPSTPADPLSFCGEASVLSINNGGITAAGSGSLKAQVSVKDLDVTFVNGWMTLTTPSATAIPGSAAGLPVLGSAFYRANSGPQSFGAAMEHRFTR